MRASKSATLLISRRILRLLMGLNALYGVLVLAMFIAAWLYPAWTGTALGVRLAAGGERLFDGMRLVMVLGLTAVPLTHLVLARLLAIVDTVGLGDPFTLLNATRLRAIAWFLLTLEGLHLAIVAVARIASSELQGLDVGRSFSVTRWLAVLLLFVLAQVFEQGARMRDELEGTI